MARLDVGGGQEVEWCFEGEIREVLGGCDFRPGEVVCDISTCILKGLRPYTFLPDVY